MRHHGSNRRYWALLTSIVWVGIAAPLILAAPKEGLTMKVEGTFEVAMNPESDSPYEETNMGVFTLEKTFAGPLAGASSGHVLTGMGDPPSSAAYVAVERFVGSLEGREGSFMMAHLGVRTAESQDLTIRVVPDSGTGQLRGLSGDFVIRIENGDHFYSFDYSFD